MKRLLLVYILLTFVNGCCSIPVDKNVVDCRNISTEEAATACEGIRYCLIYECTQDVGFERKGCLNETSEDCSQCMALAEEQTLCKKLVDRCSCL